MEIIEIKPTITNNKATICLNMIVKDESYIIKGTHKMLCNKIKFNYWEKAVPEDKGASGVKNRTPAQLFQPSV